MLLECCCMSTAACSRQGIAGCEMLMQLCYARLDSTSQWRADEPELGRRLGQMGKFYCVHINGRKKAHRTVACSASSPCLVCQFCKMGSLTVVTAVPL